MDRALEAPSDNVLVSGVGDRNQQALAEIYRRHGGAVWAVAKRVCGDAALAEGVCEGVFTDLWARRERFDPARGSLRSWLVARAHARAVATARKAGSEPGTARRDTPPSAEVEVAAHAAALTGDARRALDRLPPAERDALLLAHLGGHDVRETARLLGTSEATVKSLVRSGLASLRQALDAGAQGVTR